MVCVISILIIDDDKTENIYIDDDDDDGDDDDEYEYEWFLFCFYEVKPYSTRFFPTDIIALDWPIPNAFLSSQDIDAVEAWRFFPAPPSNNVVVAVIDTGIDYTHQDLKDAGHSYGTVMALVSEVTITMACYGPSQWSHHNHRKS